MGIEFIDQAINSVEELVNFMRLKLKIHHIAQDLEEFHLILRKVLLTKDVENDGGIPHFVKTGLDGQGESGQDEALACLLCSLAILMLRILLGAGCESA